MCTLYTIVLNTVDMLLIFSWGYRAATSPCPQFGWLYKHIWVEKCSCDWNNFVLGITFGFNDFKLGKGVTKSILNGFAWKKLQNVQKIWGYNIDLTTCKKPMDWLVLNLSILILGQFLWVLISFIASSVLYIYYEKIHSVTCIAFHWK